jgi:hypothetical protein
MQISSRTKKESSQRALNLAVSKLRRFSRAIVSKLLVIKIRSASCEPRKVYAEVKSHVEFDKTLRVLEKKKGQYYIRFLRVSLSSCRGIHLSLGNRISVFHLERQTPERFWLICICATHAGIGLTMGMHIFALIMIIFQRDGVRSGCYPRGARKDQSAGSRKLSREIFGSRKNAQPGSPELPFCLCHAYLLSTTATGIAKIHKG